MEHYYVHTYFPHYRMYTDTKYLHHVGQDRLYSRLVYLGWFMLEVLEMIELNDKRNLYQ